MASLVVAATTMRLGVAGGRMGMVMTGRTARPATATTTTRLFRRGLNTETAPILYSAHAKVVGARTGYAQDNEYKEKADGVDMSTVMI